MFRNGSALSAALLVAALFANCHAAAPKGTKPPLPAAQQTPVEQGHRRLGEGGIVDVETPDGWDEAVKSATPNRCAFVSKDRLTMISIEVVPATVQIDKNSTALMVKKMKENRKAAKQTYVDEPKPEKDDRFLLRLHERYNVKDKVADQLHLYRAVGNRVLLVVVNCMGGEEQAKEMQKQAEDISLSATNTTAKPAKSK